MPETYKRSNREKFLRLYMISYQKVNFINITDEL